MAYDEITVAEIQPGLPVTQSLWQKVADNFTYLRTEVDAGGVPPSNGSFEIYSGDDGVPDNWEWTVGTGTIGLTNSAGKSVDGEWAVEIEVISGSAGTLVSDYIPVTDDLHYHLRWSMLFDSATTDFRIYIQQYDEDKVAHGTPVIDIYDEGTSNPTSWTTRIRDYKPTNGTNWVRIRLQPYGGTAGTVYLDGLAWTEAPVWCTVGTVYTVQTLPDATPSLPNTLTKMYVFDKMQYGGEVRVKVTMRCLDIDGNSWYKIYVNDVLVGATHNHQDNDPAETFSDDIIVQIGDEVQIWANDDDSFNTEFTNMKMQIGNNGVHGKLPNYKIA